MTVSRRGNEGGLRGLSGDAGFQYPKEKARRKTWCVHQERSPHNKSMYQIGRHHVLNGSRIPHSLTRRTCKREQGQTANHATHTQMMVGSTPWEMQVYIQREREGRGGRCFGAKEYSLQNEGSKPNSTYGRRQRRTRTWPIIVYKILYHVMIYYIRL